MITLHLSIDEAKGVLDELEEYASHLDQEWEKLPQNLENLLVNLGYRIEAADAV